MKVARVFLVATVLAFVIAFSNAACPAGLPANYYCRESTVNSSPYCNWITNSSNAVVLSASDGCARAITANTKLFGVSYKAFQVSNAGSVAFTPQPSNSLLAAQCTSTASNNICSTPKILNNYPLILAGRSAWTFNSKSSMVIGTIGAVPFRVRFFTWANFGSAVNPSDFQVQLFENGDRWERYSVLARRINAPTFETGTANFAANVPEVCNAAPIVDRCTEIFYVPPNPSLVVRSSIIYQGQLGELEASIDLGAASMDLGTVFEWDLDGDGVFGEVGPSADNGDEIGQYVQYRTIRRSGSVVTAGLHPVIVRARLIGVSAPSNLIATSSGQNVDVRNTRPTLTVAKTFNVVGSSTTLTASCSDPDGNSIDWDLDGDGVYGETGLAAANGDEVGSSVRFSTYVDTRERIIQVRSRCFDGTLYSPIAVSNVYVPGIQRQCSCQRGRAFDRLNSVNLYDSTFVDLINSNKLHLVSSAALTGSVATGSVFQKTPFTFNTFTESAFEICAEFEVETYAGLAGHPDVTDGGLSIIISKLSNSYPNAAGSSTGLIGRPGSSGVSVRWSSATADPSVVFGTTLGYSSSSFPAGFPINDRHRHQIQVRYWYTQLDVWIDGVLVHSTTVDLFPTNVWGTGPERTFYVGLAATTTTGYTQDIVVDTDFAVCKLNFASTP